MPIIKKIIRVFVIVIAVCFLIYAIVASLAMFGIAIGLIFGILAYTSEGFRVWLFAQPGYRGRLAKLPGFRGDSPSTLAIAFFVYFVPLSVVCWLLLMQSVAASRGFVIVFIFGIGGLVLGYLWLLRGWRVEDFEEEVSSPEFSVSDSVAFLKQNKAIGAGLGLVLLIPLFCSTLVFGSSLVSSIETTPSSEVALESASDEEVEESASTTEPVTEAVTQEEEVEKDTPEPEETDTAVPASTSTTAATSTSTNTPKPTNTTAPTATSKPQIKISSATANIRSGPGTSFGVLASVSQNDFFDVVATNKGGDWYLIKLPNGNYGWVGTAVFDTSLLLASIPIAETVPAPPATSPPLPTNTQVPLATNTQAPQPTDTAVPVPATNTPEPVAEPGNVVITYIYFDGQEPRKEGDEYAVITNQGGSPVNMGGWRLNAGADGQNFGFPGFDLLSGQSCRVYTNQVHADSCGGQSFNSGSALWNNGGDCGHLFDTSGVEVSTYCY